MTSLSETALIVAIPEAEPVVGGVRARHDPAATEGVPAHVTVLYPFLPPSRISTEVVQSLRDIFSRCSAFRAEFAEIRRFPTALYLAPVPQAPFRVLTERVTKRFPEAPPYGGQYAECVPHLTIAHAHGAEVLEKIAQRFEISARGRLPIQAVIREVTLIENASGGWRTRLSFPLQA